MRIKTRMIEIIMDHKSREEPFPTLAAERMALERAHPLKIIEEYNRLPQHCKQRLAHDI